MVIDREEKVWYVSSGITGVILLIFFVIFGQSVVLKPMVFLSNNFDDISIYIILYGTLVVFIGLVYFGCSKIHEKLLATDFLKDTKGDEVK